MTETINTTSVFNLPVDELIETAYEMLGGEHISGYDAKSARRQLNLLLIDLANRNYPLARMEERTLDLVDGTATYDLGADVLAILDTYLVRPDQPDTPLSEIGFMSYFSIVNKTVEGVPTQMAFSRTSLTPNVSLYPTPEDSTWDLKYYAVVKHKDVDASYQLMDVSQGYLPALVAGLAYFIGLSRVNVPKDQLNYIKQEYEERLIRAFGEDRDRIDLQIIPYVRSY